VRRWRRSAVSWESRSKDSHLERAISRSDAAEAKTRSAASERVLRAKYLDWCSARIAERFLELTPDEIYELAQRATREREEHSGGAIVASDPHRDRVGREEGVPMESYRQIIERVTEALASTVTLPEFDEWRVSYEQSPARYDVEMLGFWKEKRTD
jgi:hypothetical protein